MLKKIKFSKKVDIKNYIYDNYQKWLSILFHITKKTDLSRFLYF